jgi:hypothetical protein
MATMIAMTIAVAKITPGTRRKNPLTTPAAPTINRLDSNIASGNSRMIRNSILNAGRILSNARYPTGYYPDNVLNI